MSQGLITLLVLLALLAALPWALKKLKWRPPGAVAPGELGAAQLISVLPLGPQQRLMTVEVGPPQARIWLVLGVTAQAVTTLHSMPATRAAPAPAHGVGPTEVVDEVV